MTDRSTRGLGEGKVDGHVGRWRSVYGGDWYIGLDGDTPLSRWCCTFHALWAVKGGMYLDISSCWDCCLNSRPPLGECVLVDEGIQNADGAGKQRVCVGKGQSACGRVIRGRLANNWLKQITVFTHVRGTRFDNLDDWARTNSCSADIVIMLLRNRRAQIRKEVLT